MIDYIEAEPFNGHPIRYYDSDGIYFNLEDIYSILSREPAYNPDSQIAISEEGLHRLLVHSSLDIAKTLLAHIEKVMPC